MWASIFKLIVGAFLDWAARKIGALIAKFKKREEIDEQAEDATKKLKDAKTKEEIDAGIDDGLKDI